LADDVVTNADPTGHGCADRGLVERDGPRRLFGARLTGTLEDRLPLIIGSPVGSAYAITQLRSPINSGLASDYSRSSAPSSSTPKMIYLTFANSRKKSVRFQYIRLYVTFFR
jgi:hypothetical protein